MDRCSAIGRSGNLIASEAVRENEIFSTEIGFIGVNTCSYVKLYTFLIVSSKFSRKKEDIFYLNVETIFVNLLES